MTPQSQFTVVAPLAAGSEPALRALLATMSPAPGMADPRNALVPFGEFAQLHFARFVILNDPTLGDIEVYGTPRPGLPTYLAFVGDCDGPSQDCLADLARRSGAGLRRIFAHCTDFTPGTDLLAWLRAHDLPIAASYVNWVGRTVRQIKQGKRPATGPVGTGRPHAAGIGRGRAAALAGDGQLCQERGGCAPPDAHATGSHAAAMAAGEMGQPAAQPARLVARATVSDRVVAPVDIATAAAGEAGSGDLPASRVHFAGGVAEPRRSRRHESVHGFRLGKARCVSPWVDHIRPRGNPIHRPAHIHARLPGARSDNSFARWVFVDGKRRVLFTSNYDGGHQAYMDDFINKAAWGLNVAFSSGVGWPHTDYLIARGARREHYFKYFQRRHQLPTQVWYKAYPGLTLTDLERNARIRQGLERTDVSAIEALEWLKLL